jgi:type I restriction enzyme S subunit
MSEVEWQPGLLREIAQPVGDKWVPSSIDANIPYVGLEHISPESPRIRAYGKSSDVISIKNQFRAGDTLFGKLRPYLKKVAHADLSGVCSTDIIPIRANQKGDPSYLYYLLSSPKVIAKAVESSAGNVMPRASWSDLADIEIEIPPLPEQKKIAEILSGIDTKRQALAKKVVNTSMLRNALGKKIFSSLNGERVPLGELCNPKQWQTISTNQLTTSGYPVYGANGKIGYFTEYNHKEPVLAVTCRGATCGNLTLVPAFSYVTGNSMCLDNPREDTSPEYLFQFLSWRGLKDVISGSAQPQITRSPLQAVEVVLPSKERQGKIVSALESVNNAENIMNIALGRLDLLKQAIAADLLSGRKRVSV